MGGLMSELGGFAYLDANILVYAVEGYPDYENQVRAILAAMDHGDLVVATSELTLAEVLVKPKQVGNASLERAYQEFLEPSPAFVVAPITRTVLVEAAGIRARTALKLPDALHLATALSLGCSSFLTNDHSFRGVSTPRVILLPELDPA